MSFSFLSILFTLLLGEWLLALFVSVFAGHQFLFKCWLVLGGFLQYLAVSQTSMGAKRATVVTSTSQRRLIAMPFVPTTFLVPIPDRTADTLMAVISEWIEPGSRVTVALGRLTGTWTRRDTRTKQWTIRLVALTCVLRHIQTRSTARGVFLNPYNRMGDSRHDSKTYSVHETHRRQRRLEGFSSPPFGCSHHVTCHCATLNVTDNLLHVMRVIAYRRQGSAPMFTGAEEHGVRVGTSSFCTAALVYHIPVNFFCLLKERGSLRI